MQFISEGMNDSAGKGYPQLDNTGLVSLDEIADIISGESTYTAGDIKGVVAAVSREIARQTAQGRGVKIAGLGTFRATLTLQKDVKPETKDSSTHLSGRSVRIGNVRFLADKQLITEANRWGNFSRKRPEKQEKPAPPPPEQRLSLLLDYLSRHSYITVFQYQKLTTLCHTTAARELRNLYLSPDSPIDAEGTGSHRVYTLRK